MVLSYHRNFDLLEKKWKNLIFFNCNLLIHDSDLYYANKRILDIKKPPILGGMHKKDSKTKDKAELQFWDDTVALT